MAKLVKALSNKKEGIQKKKKLDVSPDPFNSQHIQTVPPMLTGVTEWLINIKPTRTNYFQSYGLPLSYSYYQKPSNIKFLNKSHYPIESIKQNLEVWLKLMVEPLLVDDLSPSAVSMYAIRGDQWWTEKSVSNKFKVVIKESPTLPIFEMAKRSAEAESPTGKQYENENQHYLKNVNCFKKMNDMDTQTPIPLCVPKSCGCKKGVLANKGTMNFISDFHDVELISEEIESQSKRSILPSNKLTNLEIDTQQHKESNSISKKSLSLESLTGEDFEFDELWEARKMVGILNSEEFFKIAIIIGRVLERNEHEINQVYIKKGTNLDPLSRLIRFKYTIKHIRIARFSKVWSMPVTSMSINPINKNIFATGHGQFFENQPTHLGRVNIWNLKNLSIPEKSVDFNHGVTCVSFSEASPFALLVSFISGNLLILDISTTTPTVIVSNKGESLNGPLWQANWFRTHNDKEMIVTCGTEGLISCYDTTQFEKKQLMLFSKREGLVRGIKVPQPFSNSVKIKQRPDVYCIVPHPVNPFIYLAGTEDGCLHVCSTDYCNEHLQSIQCHHGPIHHIKYHPDTNLVVLSVGVDYCVRIWATNIYEPLITIYTHEDYVEDAAWSPQHPSIIATVGGCYLSIWDIRLISTEPRNSIRSPTGTRLTTVDFLNGNTVITGDVCGDLHVWGLSDLPFIISNKTEAFANSIKRVLTGKMETLEELRKLGYPFDLDDVHGRRSKTTNSLS